MAAMQPDDDTVIVVQIPLSVAQAIGCRPNAVVSLRIRDGEISVVPNQLRIDASDSQRPRPTATDLWVSCQSWWKERGGTKGAATSV